MYIHIYIYRYVQVSKYIFCECHVLDEQTKMEVKDTRFLQNPSFFLQYDSIFLIEVACTSP